MENLTDFLFMLENIHPNRHLYKDSGLWYFYDDDATTLLFEQNQNESFYNFIRRIFNETYSSIDY